jgi:hypothetical protein
LKNNYRVKDDEIKNNVDMSSTIEKENINFFGIYYSLDDYRIQTELNNEKINENTKYLDTIKFQKSYFYKQLYENKIIQKPNSKNLIERFNIFIVMIHMFISRRHTRHHTPCHHASTHNYKFEAIQLAIVAKCLEMPSTLLEAEASVESGILQLLMAQGKISPSKNQCLFFC